MKLDELKKVCDEAGVMPSDPYKIGPKVIPDDRVLRWTDPDIVEAWIRERHARFYATFNPETVRKLLAVAEAIRDALPKLPSKEAWRTVMGPKLAQRLFDALAALESD